MNPVFLVFCVIMFGVFYQKGLRFFLALGHGKVRSHIEGALVGLVVGFGFPLAVLLYGAERKPPAPQPAVEAPAVPDSAGGAASGSTAQEPVRIPE